MKLGFGVFTTTFIPASAPIHLQGVADYEFLDPYAMIQVRPTLSDRKAGDRTHDTVTVYGPAALINASCAEHANVFPMCLWRTMGVGIKEFFCRADGHGNPGVATVRQ